MLKKRRIVLGAAVIAAAALVIGTGVSLAYLGYVTRETENQIKVGHGDETINEPSFTPPTEQSVTSNPPVTKQFFVNNTGSVPAFARIYAEFSDSELAAHAMVSTDGTNFVSWDQFKTNLTAPASSLPAEYHWRYVPATNGTSEKISGYFYYTDPIPVGGNTPQLFDSVKLDYARYDENNDVVDDSNIDLIKPTEMIVYSELVQTVETGEWVDPTDDTKKERGYDYAATGVTDGWLKAWKSFLKVS